MLNIKASRYLSIGYLLITLYRYPLFRALSILKMQPTGMLGEGKVPASEDIHRMKKLRLADGIHVDMNHLKTGEVK